jgi:hypothetical protein
MDARNTFLQLSTDAIVDCRDILCHTAGRSVLKLEKERGSSLASEKPIGEEWRFGREK